MHHIAYQPVDAMMLVYVDKQRLIGFNLELALVQAIILHTKRVFFIHIGFEAEVFTGRMPFPSPNPKRQNTKLKGSSLVTHMNKTIKTDATCSQGDKMDLRQLMLTAADLHLRQC